MEYKLLHKILLTAEKENTISGISKHLYLSQPYVSQIIKRAEKQYDVTLIQRNQFPIKVTEAGKQLTKSLEKIISDEAQIYQILRPYKTSELTTIKLSITPSWIPTITPLIIEELQEKFKNVTFEIYDSFTSINSLKDLLSHNIDVYWGALLHNSQLESHYLYRSQACIIIPQTHTLYKSNQKEILFSNELFSKLNNSSVISLTDNSAFQRIVDHLFEDFGLHTNKIIKVNNFSAAISLSLDSDCITTTLVDNLELMDLHDIKFNIIKIPPEILNLDVGINYDRNSSSLTKKIAKEMAVIIKENMCK